MDVVFAVGFLLT